MSESALQVGVIKLDAGTASVVNGVTVTPFLMKHDRPVGNRHQQHAARLRICAAGLICTCRRKALGPHARSSIPCGDNRASILGPSAPPSATIKAEIPTFQMRIITLASIS